MVAMGMDQANYTTYIQVVQLYITINPWYDQEKRPHLSRKTFLSKVHLVKELIASYRKMYELLKLDLPNRSYG